MAGALDEAALAFGAGGAAWLNVALGLIMFGVALDLRVADFMRVAYEPRGPLIGLLCQFLLLPAVTFALVVVIQPSPSIALGMILVAACPGGNISNFLTHLAGGNAALSIAMTAVSTTAATVATPANLAFWGSLRPDTARILHGVGLDPFDLLGTLAVILGIPIALGMTTAAVRPALAARMRTPFKIGSILFFLAFVAFTLYRNLDNFAAYVGAVAGVVALQNATALALGYSVARAAGLARRDARAISMEVGIQNSGLGLILVFTYFGGLGGMALVTAWWGVWHIVAGLALATCWLMRDRLAGHAA